MVYDDSKLLDAHRLAKRLGVKKTAIYDWIRSPDPIPAYHVGVRALRFRWSEVLAWLEKRRVTRVRVRAPRSPRSASARASAQP